LSYGGITLPLSQAEKETVKNGPIAYNQSGTSRRLIRSSRQRR